MDWDWVKGNAPTITIIGTVVGMFFLFDGWQMERFRWLAGDIGKLDLKMDKVEARLAGDIEGLSKRLGKVETLSAAAMTEMRRQPGMIGDGSMFQLLAGKRTAVPVSYVAPNAADSPSFDVRKMLPATYSDNKLTLYPDAEDASLIALLLQEGWRQVDPADVARGFVFRRSP